VWHSARSSSSARTDDHSTESVDSAGRFLPDASWPDDRQAPGNLEFVRRLANSTNRENGAERFPDAQAVDRWLADEGRPSVRASAEEHRRLITVRDSIGELAAAHRRGDVADEPTRRLADALGTASFVVGVSGDDALRLAGAPGSSFDRLMADVALIVHEAAQDGRWDRLIACQHCSWVVYDLSKNRSARWCSACGGRENAKAYRQRRSGSGGFSRRSP
jgi:predicted RNA-binding Zn ribbon-like protein